MWITIKLTADGMNVGKENEPLEDQAYHHSLYTFELERFVH